ncbi:ABC transporter permease [Citrobacter freundii]
MFKRKSPVTASAPNWRLRCSLLAGSFILLLGFLAPILIQQDPNTQNLNAVLLPPVWQTGGSFQYPLGTTALGENILTQLIYGTRTAILIALGAASGCAVMGIGLGIVAGYMGGLIEKGILLLVEFWMTFPAVILALLLVVTFSPGLLSVVIAIVLVDWTRFCRVIHAEVSELKSREFIYVAKLMGASQLSIILRDIIPSLIPGIIMLFSTEMAISVLIESTLSFIGVSVDPAQPSWGAMIAQGMDYAYASPWLLLQPALCIVFFVLICMTFNDGMTRNVIPHKEQ